MSLPKILLLLLALAGLIGLVYYSGALRPGDEKDERALTLESLNSGNREGDGRGEEGGNGTSTPIGLQDFKDLAATNRPQFIRALERISSAWKPEFLIMLLEVSRMRIPGANRSELIEVMQRKTGQDIGFNDMQDWMPYYWNLEIENPENYAEFKSWLYEKIDPKFTAYFDGHSDGGIGLDEIVWGGVQQDGIPPLNKPDMVAADEATFMGDDNVVFGVEINGDARAYPKRILAWHEMFKDTIGGVSVCGVY